VKARLRELKEIKDVFGATVNDIVLTVVAGGLGRCRWTAWRSPSRRSAPRSSPPF